MRRKWGDARGRTASPGFLVVFTPEDYCAGGLCFAAPGTMLQPSDVAQLRDCLTLHLKAIGREPLEPGDRVLVVKDTTDGEALWDDPRAPLPLRLPNGPISSPVSATVREVEPDFPIGAAGPLLRISVDGHRGLRLVRRSQLEVLR